LEKRGKAGSASKRCEDHELSKQKKASDSESEKSDDEGEKSIFNRDAYQEYLSKKCLQLSEDRSRTQQQRKFYLQNR